MDREEDENWDMEFHDNDDGDELDGSLLDYPDQLSNISNSEILKSESNHHGRCIVHIDIDCFYAQVEMNKNPSIREQPVGIKQKNLVVTTNYIARKAGVPKSCWIQDAIKVCPSLILINGEDLHDYRRVSQSIFELLKSYNVPVERLGMDENYLDVTDLIGKYERSQTSSFEGHDCYVDSEPRSFCKCGCYERLKIASCIAKEIRQKLYTELSITTSAGIAHNKLLAKMVGGRHKPDDQTTLFSSDVNRFIIELDDVSKIPGIGSAMFKTLKENGISKVVDVQQAGLQKLAGFLDEITAKRVWDWSFGRDDSEVKRSVPSKSIGLEDRFKGLYTKEECVKKLEWLLNRLSILVHEDGRLPSVIKVTARDFFKDKFIKKFHKESRQTKINPRLFESLLNSRELEAAARYKIQTMIVQLLQKMVVMDQKFHLTLLGLSVSGFAEKTKKNISSFFGNLSSQTTQCLGIGNPAIQKTHPVEISASVSAVNSVTRSSVLSTNPETQSSVSVKNSVTGSLVLSTNPVRPFSVSVANSLVDSSFLTTSPVCGVRKRIYSEDNTEADVSSHKRQRVIDDEFQSVDPEVFSQLPETIQNEILESNTKKLPKPLPKQSNPNPLISKVSARIPAGWDVEVFNQLPMNIRQELLIREDLTTTAPSCTVTSNTSSKPSKSKTKPSNKISMYFQKK